MKIKIFLIAISSVLLSSCAAIVKSADVKTANIWGPKITQIPTLADLDVKEQKVKVYHVGKKGVLMTNLKALAVTDALNKSNADVLVEPRYTLVSTGSEISIKVSGYPATYRNFRAMEQKDTTIVKYSMKQYSIGQKLRGTSAK